MATRHSTDRGPDKARRDQMVENATRRLLRDLIRRAASPVPRKLNRAGEIYGLYLQVARENGRTPHPTAPDHPPVPGPGSLSFQAP